MLRRAVLGVLAAAVALPAAATGQTLTQPMSDFDLFAASKGEGQVVEKTVVQENGVPPTEPTPLADCGPGSRPQPGVDGRVPAGSAKQGLWCNVDAVGHHGTSGGFKVLRYVDAAGRECAYYDTALLFPINAFKFDTTSLGVQVLDMSDPANPRRTATLTEPPMLSPHESLALNPKRGLLAAVMGNPFQAPGLVTLYDVSQDCRHPVLQSTTPAARVGHESGFAQDGRTYYATGAAGSVTAVDVTDPKAPFAVWQGQVDAHGMTLNADGTRAYVADPLNGEMAILDTSQVQARAPAPQVREISRLTWQRASIPQNAIPFSRGGRQYVLETDEYNAGVRGGGQHDVGAARIIDVTNENRPTVVSNLRLAVNQPAEHAEARDDPGAFSPVQGYAAHYCDVSSPVDPTVVACSFIASGLRVFDISDLAKPKQIAYHVAPTKPVVENGTFESAFAMSKPTVVPGRREVWYADGATGFHVLRVAEAVWPAATSAGTRSCVRKRRFVARVRLPKGVKARTVRARFAGAKVKRAAQVGRRIRAKVRVRGTRTRATLKVRVKARGGRTIRRSRTYRLCAARR